MSVTATWCDGVFKPSQPPADAAPGQVYRVFSEQEFHELTEGIQWLKASESAFAFWDNDDDAVYDTL